MKRSSVPSKSVPSGYTKLVIATIAILSAFMGAFWLLTSPLWSQSGAQKATYKVLHVAAASDLQPIMPAFTAAYERETGTRLQVSFASSSTLATQIVNGAPVDVFLGADFSFPEKVVAANLTTEKAPVAYAQGTLVLWARKDSPIQPLSLERLSDPQVTRIAVADEFHAPYGRAAYAAMRQLKIFNSLQTKLVSAENIGQAAQFAESGNAQAAFLSLTLAESDHLKQTGTYVRIPNVYPKILQYGVVLKHSPHLAEATNFLNWMTSPKVQEQLTKYGLTPVR